MLARLDADDRGRAREAEKTATRLLNLLDTPRPRARRNTHADTCRALVSLTHAKVLHEGAGSILVRWASTYIQRALGCALGTARRIRSWLVEALGGRLVLSADGPGRDTEAYALLPSSSRHGALLALRQVLGSLPAPLVSPGLLGDAVPLAHGKPGAQRCPFHGDRRASLSIFRGRSDGRLLAKCHASDCGVLAVVDGSSCKPVIRRAGSSTATRGGVAPGSPSSGRTARGCRSVDRRTGRGERRVLSGAQGTGDEIDRDCLRGEREAKRWGWQAAADLDPAEVPRDRLLDTCWSYVEGRDEYGRPILGAPQSTDCAVLDLDGLRWPGNRPDDARLQAIEARLIETNSVAFRDVRLHVTSRWGLQIVCLLPRRTAIARLDAAHWARCEAVAAEALAELGVGGHLDRQVLKPGGTMRRAGWRVDREGDLWQSYYVTGARGRPPPRRRGGRMTATEPTPRTRQHVTAETRATFARLPHGDWGLRVTGPFAPGDVVSVTLRDGGSVEARIGLVIWEGEGHALTTVVTDRAGTA